MWQRIEGDDKSPGEKNSKEVLPRKHLPLPSFHGPPISPEAAILDREITKRRFSCHRLYSPGRILHLMYKKRSPEEKGKRREGPRYEAFWRQPEHFLQLEVMPRMVLDHLPEKVLHAVNDVLHHHSSPVLTT
ncbi:hypothetical protein J437_LFUL003533 [Ladona fulva]|uniref:Uncharacterized protein n=1 Tax=Ladona fulva TaxID=123851 RepID=A0A8K0NV08_LADFU|nr:hypothetical protein J437_LFUL003533 [Ladona fulva]